MFFKTRYFLDFFQLFAFLHVLLPGISAKGITDLPLCSLSCVTREAVDLRCLLTDTSCLCSKPTFITGTITCAQSRCKRPDLSTANGVLAEMCAAVSISSSSSSSSTLSSSTTSESKSTLTSTSSPSSTLTPPPRASTTGSLDSEPSTTVVIATVFDPPSSLGIRTRGNLWGGLGPAVTVALGLGLKMWI
ncbi:uncharacterized protein LACBIDRAFT_296573 [Laccaria bicolor S238N-H82]|uniref:Predicted protein n=1 Tax=Laccaria bicolor (strain S238N-H82 / ATCC MYA-4686) TaxID=486041 RepID=B0D953_LACBS|nr:uncharacterized protein LACBIDRAFT_296573 [Laccaria bicolor S238N-H82]EDR08952.1 predicted protein [Laccaria bicolor S238N-H82]|eukprot:XP_001880265.1 predicted protein [Laccaria bicolor S238N-H82]